MCVGGELLLINTRILKTENQKNFRTQGLIELHEIEPLRNCDSELPFVVSF